MGLNVVILAAGQGTRMHSAKPKVLHALAGRSLIEHVLATARTLKPSRICVVYGHGGERVPRALTAPDLVFVKQEPQLGTGHALMQALPELDRNADTLVLYGDVPLISAESLSALVAGDGERVVILTAKLNDPFGYGRIVRNATGAITGIVEEKEATSEQRAIREINTGIMLLPGTRLTAWLSGLSNRNQQHEYYLTDVVALALKDGVRIDSREPADVAEILGVNSKQQLAHLERLFQMRTANSLLAAGVTLTDPARLDVRGELKVGRDVRIDVNCVFEGRVELGDEADIGAHCIVRDSVIGTGTRIEPFSLIDGAVIGPACRVGPYARIRPGTQLAEDVHIGNFVEVKAATIGARSKANHLSYVGDAVVGANVNIGAGTITCNYDGANKHRTVIEDDVHIGSDVQLVAPVTVAKGVTVGAGTTVWRETTPGGLVINQKTQQHRPEWQRPRKKSKE
jgi:bifunctional UDP-N-acetylglucosamine pyrophosphorylase/glucosamine-1-phosphate N-acetyltransferase